MRRIARLSSPWAFRASFMRHDEDAVPILGRRVFDVEFAAEVVDLAGPVVLIDFKRLAEVLEGLRELHELVELSPLA
jgi:hypothetical protein